MLKIILIALGGALGALARYGLSGWVQHRWGGVFPAGTLVVNVVGCFCIGVLMALVVDHPTLRPETRDFLGIGILGAFTTFSTFGYETSALLHDGEWGLAAANVAANVVVGLLAVELGRLAARLVNL